MENIINIVIYIYIKYPNRFELSKARLVKLIYLADWKNAIENGSQLTNIKWVFNHYGPYVEEIINIIRSDKRFEIKVTSNFWGSLKEIIIIKQEITPPSISEKTKSILDFVIEKTSGLDWNNFIKLVYSTYPIQKMPRYSILNLVELAKEYKAIKK